jgi:MFS family permease
MSAILLLSIVSAITKTGMSLSTPSLVEATKSLHLSAFMYSASASATSLAMAATAMAAGVVADRLGRHRVLMGSFVIAGGANLAICLFPTGPVYLGGLTLAGVGYSIMVTSSFAYVRAVAPGRSLGWGLGLFGLFSTLMCAVTSVLVVTVLMGGDALSALQDKGLTQADVQSAIASAEGSQGAGIQNVAQAYPQAVAQITSMFGSALQTLMLFGAIVMVATSVASWLLLRDRRAPSA